MDSPVKNVCYFSASNEDFTQYKQQNMLLNSVDTFLHIDNNVYFKTFQQTAGIADRQPPSPTGLPKQEGAARGSHPARSQRGSANPA